MGEHFIHSCYLETYSATLTLKRKNLSEAGNAQSHVQESKQKNAWPFDELNGKKRSNTIAVARIILYLILAACPKPGPTNSEEQNEGGTLRILRIHQKPANSRTKPEAIMNRILW